MRRNFILPLIFFIGVAVFWSVIPTGCANIIPPGGGPRDSTAPVAVSILPKDSTLNFKGNRIVFTFDEYIDDPQDIQNNLLFTPTFEVNPEIAIRAKVMTVRFRDSLLPNTTYTLNFGNAIRDINENNVLRNFVYTFSTGPVLDSLTLSGKVVLAQTGKTDSTLLVLLHRNKADSAVRRQRPTYIARVDANGNFRFQNLPKDSFAIYALGDAGPNQRRYQDTSRQLFAFANEAVTIGETKDVTLYAYKVQAVQNNNTAAPQPNQKGAANDRRLRFTTTTGNLDLQSDFLLNFPTPLQRFDSGLISLSTDSSFTPATYRVSIDSSKKIIRFSSAWKEGVRYNLILDKEFAEDSAGKKLLKTDTLNFTTKKRSDYGQVNIKMRNVEAGRNPVLQFVQNSEVVFSASIRSGVFTSALFTPGEYELRILYDTNNNGKWDPGQFFGAKRQPELVKTVGRQITVKAAWANEFDITL